ncbi:MAG: hypothetical protein AB1813_19550 [Verrucomicrobiota bacterium]|jgi:hypothetical protein
MKPTILCIAATLAACSLLAADTPKDDVIAAAKKLGEKDNYSWKTTVEVPASSQFRPGPTEGKTEKGGYTHVTMTFGDNSMVAITKGEKGAVTSPEGGWQSLAEIESSEGQRRFIGMMVRNLRTPATQAEELATQSKDLKKEGDVYSGALTEEGAKNFLRFRRGGGGDGPSISNATGSVKFWVKDGSLSKYEFHVKGTVSFNGNDRDVDRRTTVEVKDVGTTKIDVPEEAKKKLS